MARGISQYNVALMHVTNHAFLKHYYSVGLSSNT